MTVDLDAVRTRHDAYLISHDHAGSFACCTAHASAGDVLALVAEVERLRKDAGTYFCTCGGLA